ncbi:MAG: recombinase family protein [Actinomycetota bacterium]|nr:recombinase family protein [Actinomycetota bacterium]
MPRFTVIAVVVALVLLSIAAPSATAQHGFAAQPQELWEEFPLDSDTSPAPQPDGQEPPPPEPQEKQTAPQTPAPSAGERVAEEPGGDGLSLWLLPVLGLLAFTGGVFAAKAAVRFTQRRRQTARGRPAPAEQPGARAESKPSAGERVQEPATEVAAAAPRRSALAPKQADQPVGAKPPAPVEKEKPTPVKKPAPVVAEKAAPVKEQKPAPVVAEKPTRVKEQTPTRVTEQKPQPVKEDKRAPVVAEQPAPEEKKKPVPVKEQEPAPVEVEKPATVVAQKPAPVEQDKPAPVAEEKPAPEKTPARHLSEPSPPPQTEKPKLGAAEPTQPRRSKKLPDDVIPFPTQPGRIGRHSSSSAPPQRALGYVSAADADAPASDLETQTAEIRSACIRNGFESVEVVRDFESHSGSDLERPGLIYAIERLEAGEASCLVVASLERLTRSAAHLGTLIDRLGESRIRLVVLDIQLDTGNPDGRLAAEALANVGTLERKSLDTRTRKGLQAAREARQSSGRPAVADRPALKERIADMRARGMTLQAIADTLNSEGVPTLRGGTEWRPSSVQAAVGYKRPKRGARKSGNGSSGSSSKGTPVAGDNG